MSDIKIDKSLLAPEDFENYKTITLDDGSQEEVYISRAGNIVTDPKLRNKSRDDVERRQLCWDLYVKSWRKGAPNSRQAGRDAGYSENSALNICNQKWFKEKKQKLRQSRMMDKAERNLSRILDLDYSKMKILEDGTEEESIDKDVLRVVADVSKTIVTTLGKDTYSTKTEVGGKMESEIKINSVSYADPIQIENEIVDEHIKMVEGEIVKAIENENKEE